MLEIAPVKLPHTRNVVRGFIIAIGIITAGLVIAQDQETLRVKTSLAAEDPRFPEYLARLLGHPLTQGDTYIVHTNGEKAFPAMLDAIARAQHRVSFETYIFGTGTIPERFVTAFEAAARRGVEVKLVLDSVGASNLGDAYLKRLEDAGVRVGWFNEVASWSFEELNYRTHRKALVVDGDVAFVGGIGIADQWAMPVEGQATWRDTHVEVHGPAAVNVEAAFNENWIETGGVVDPDLLPHEDAPAGGAASIVVWSSPEGGASAMKLLYLLSIAAARKTLDIQSPYLITDESTQWSLREARNRGVRVRLLVEGDLTDAKPVKFASRADYERLMEIGIAIHEYQPAMMHTKALVVDGALSIVGSANLDNRSLELNDELNVAVFDRELATRLLADFDTDVRRSKKLDLQEWRSRPIHIRGREKLWSLFGEIF